MLAIAEEEPKEKATPIKTKTPLKAGVFKPGIYGNAARKGITPLRESLNFHHKA